MGTSDSTHTQVVKPDATLFSNDEIETSETDTEDVVLSLDISKTCVGWAISVDAELLNFGKVVFKTTTNMGQRIVAFAGFIDSVLDAYKPNKLVLEKPLNRAATRSHFEFLGVLRLKWMEFSGEEIPKEHLIPPKQVKTHMRVKRGKTHKENKKIMVDKVNTMFGLNLNFDRNSAYKSDDDVADAIAVLVTYLRIHPDT